MFRFTHVPPKSRVTTTSGSMKAPAPMVGDYAQGEAVVLGVGAQLSRTAKDVIQKFEV